MATSAGWASLGNTIAGGNKLNQTIAYEQGQNLGANTQNALAQARARIDENQARAEIGAHLDALPPEIRGTVGALIQAHQNPQEAFGAAKTNQEVNFRNQIVDPSTSDSDVARRLFALNQNADIVKQEGEGQIVNRLHPEAGIQTTQIGSSIAGKNNAAANNLNAEAALNRDKVANPQNYRQLMPNPSSIGSSDGSQPIPNETTAQLVAAGQMPAPAPGSKAFLNLGGDAFTRRVNYLAGQGGGTPPPATPPPAGTPPQAGAAKSGIELPTETAPSFKPNFDANAYGQRRTALNDLSRKSGTGGNNDALNRTAGHLDVYEQLMQNSGNSNFVADNKLKNWFKNQTGQAFPQNADLAAHILGTEIVKSMTSVGAGSAEERLGLAQAFDSAKSPEQAKSAIDTAQRLLREQAVGTNQRVSASGVKDYYSKYLTPTARRRLSVGEFDTAGQTPPPAAAGPKAGDVEQGYRFKGGDPANQANWEKV